MPGQGCTAACQPFSCSLWSSIKFWAATACRHSFKATQDWWSLSEYTVLWAVAVQVQPDEQLRYTGTKERGGGQEEAHQLSLLTHPSKPWGVFQEIDVTLCCFKDTFGITNAVAKPGNHSVCTQDQRYLSVVLLSWCVQYKVKSLCMCFVVTLPTCHVSHVRMSEGSMSHQNTASGCADWKGSLEYR